MLRGEPIHVSENAANRIKIKFCLIDTNDCTGKPRRNRRPQESFRPVCKNNLYQPCFQSNEVLPFWRIFFRRRFFCDSGEVAAATRATRVNFLQGHPSSQANRQAVHVLAHSRRD
jgi:hypothetical protein